MSRNRGIPERRPKPGRTDRMPRQAPIAKTAANQPGARSPKRLSSPQQSPAPRPRSQDDRAVLRSPQAVPPPPDAMPDAGAKASLLARFPWLSKWQFWAVSAILTFSGVGVLSLALLLKLPALPNCPAIFWPTASASLRLYCAQVAANKRTVEDLMEGIALVNSLPDDHPLRPDINRYIAEWSETVLDLAEESFHRGELDEAIATARQLPTNVPAYQGVNARVEGWQSIWSEAESIFEEAETFLREPDLRQAFSTAIKLLSVGNTYWETVKYQELTGLISTAREDTNTLGRARSLANRGGLENFLEAVKLVETIQPSSYLYAEAGRLIQQLGRDMMNLAEAMLDQRDSREAIAIAEKIPARANLQPEAQDFISLATAQSQSWQGTVADLETAIVQAQRIQRGRPLYSKAQQLIGRWQLEIQDVGRLETARRLARPGLSGDVSAAIAEARLIPRGNPRWSEAQGLIEDWTREVETAQDRPLLTQAEQLAMGGDVFSLQAAVQSVNQIGEGRALSGEARRRAQEWTAQIQRIQDQPQLDRARQLATLGDLNGAIATAGQIQSGRSLYGDAQADIRVWRDQSQGQERLREAYQSARGGTSTSLVSAIRTADQVPSGSSSRSEADRMINTWSRDILRLAQMQAVYDLEGAIALAESIPTRTEAYAEAQLQIESWRQQLAPSIPPIQLSPP